MSLLMDYMPEYYSSNVNQPPKEKYKPKAKKPENPTKIFYILKDDELNSLEPASPQAKSSYRSIVKEDLNSTKQKRIQDDLLLLLSEQPQKFASFNLPDTFNCTNKQRGLHRDSFDCTKYYFCEDNDLKFEKNVDFSEYPFLKQKAENNPIQTKAYTCPENSVFNMKGCFCDRRLDKNENCHYISETFCDFGLERGLEKKFA
jgi:hypothetical protein